MGRKLSIALKISAFPALWLSCRKSSSTGTTAGNDYRTLTKRLFDKFDEAPGL